MQQLRSYTRCLSFAAPSQQLVKTLKAEPARQYTLVLDCKSSKAQLRSAGRRSHKDASADVMLSVKRNHDELPCKPKLIIDIDDILNLTNEAVDNSIEATSQIAT